MARRYLRWWVSTGTALVGVNLGWHAFDLPASGRHYRLPQISGPPGMARRYRFW